MLRLLLLLLCLFPLVPETRAQIDFTPTVNRYLSYGEEYSTVSFKDAKRSISMEVPRKWTCRGEVGRLRFLPPDENFAEGIVEAAPAMRTRVFDEATVQALEAQVLNSVPAGSQGVSLVSRMENSVILNNQDLSYEFIVSYQTLGQTFQRSVIFVNSPDAQLIFRFTAPKAVFAHLNNVFNRTVSSWRMTEPPAAGAGPVTALK